MTTTRLIEYHITRALLERRPTAGVARGGRLAERLITVAAVVAGMLLLGAYARELLGALLAGAAVLTLGTRTR
jgi:hypothetical protein